VPVSILALALGVWLSSRQPAFDGAAPEGIVTEQRDEWSLQRRYMQHERPQTLVDNQPARLSAVVN
jgi:hypothetical protein